jgi:hypothetical protein
MDGILAHFGNPAVQGVVMEWMDLRMSGQLEHLVDGPAHDALVLSIECLFAALRRLVADHEALAALDQTASDSSTTSLDTILAQAQDSCTTDSFLDAVTALCVLRRKVVAVCLDLRDEAAVLAQLEGIVSLMAPGVSLLSVWERHGPRLGNSPKGVRDAVIEALHQLNLHCPDPSLAASSSVPEFAAGHPTPSSPVEADSP